MAADKRRADYITFVTDTIIANTAEDMGVTVMMPHTIDRDLIKRIPEYGEKFAVAPKERRTALVKREDLEFIHFECEPKVSPFLLRILHEKESMMVCWKRIEGDERLPQELLHGMVRYLSDRQVTDNGDEKAPILKSLMLEVADAEYAELMGIDVEQIQGDTGGNGDNVQLEEVANPVEEPSIAAADDPPAVETENEANDDTDAADEKEELAPPDTLESATVDEAQQAVEITDGGPSQECAADEDAECLVDGVQTDVEEQQAPAPVEETTPPDERQRPAAQGFQNVAIPPVWTPPNRRTTAAFIYLYFRQVM